MKKIRQGQTIEINGYAITPIEKVSLQGNANRFGLNIIAQYEPLGVIVETKDQNWAWDINGQLVDKDTLLCAQ